MYRILFSTRYCLDPQGSHCMSGRILAVDYGRKRIGIAISDPLGISMKTLGHISRESDTQAAKILSALIQNENASELVIGLPLHSHGDAGENVEWVEKFLIELAKHSTITVHKVDERYSSQEAEAILKEEGKWPAKPGELDAKAALVILRRHLSGES